jgi:hypothetical protein
MQHQTQPSTCFPICMRKDIRHAMHWGNEARCICCSRGLRSSKLAWKSDAGEQPDVTFLHTLYVRVQGVRGASLSPFEYVYRYIHREGVGAHAFTRACTHAHTCAHAHMMWISVCMGVLECPFFPAMQFFVNTLCAHVNATVMLSETFTMRHDVRIGSRMYTLLSRTHSVLHCTLSPFVQLSYMLQHLLHTKAHAHARTHTCIQSMISSPLSGV